MSKEKTWQWDRTRIILKNPNDEDVVLTINRGGRVLELKINKRNNYQYFNYKISKI